MDWHSPCSSRHQVFVSKLPERIRSIDRKKHDEDLAERMVGGARIDRTSRSAAGEPRSVADERQTTDRRWHERRENR
jgi:hypothetical protein